MNQTHLPDFAPPEITPGSFNKGVGWNPWHGCDKISPGCMHCYVYRGDARRGRDASICTKTSAFDLPIRKKRDGSYKIPLGAYVWTCFTSDFLLDKADSWRNDAWAMMHEREDLYFFFITKRIHRLAESLPGDWDEGYPNVSICSTVENQDRADYRLPILRDAPIKHKSIALEPLLEQVDISKYLDPWVQQVVVGGESGPDARICRYEWILSLKEQCVSAGVPFKFKQTGANFVKDGKLYRVPRKMQHSQANRAGINYVPPGSHPII